jgi:hypothetical protein
MNESLFASRPDPSASRSAIKVKSALVQVAVLGAWLLMAGGAFGQLRVVNYNIAALNGDQNALRDVFIALNNDDRPGFAVAPHLYVFQEVQTGDVTPLLNLLNAAAPAGVVYVQGTYTGSAAENGAAGAQAMYYRADTLLEDPSGHVDIATGASRNSDRWKLSLVGYGSPAATFYIYSSHLKASQGYENDRLSGATALRNDADALPAGTHIIFAGDYNVYTNTEPAYQKLISPGNAQAFDPLGTGSWAGGGNAIKHTQSPCATGCALVNGGLDDRFDLQLSTAAFHDGEGLGHIAGMYRSLGNDGNHYNTDINAGNNTYYPADVPRSNALAADLHVASDHIPVVAEYQIPGVMGADLPADFGRVIEGAVVNVELQVWNDADVLVPAGADEVDWSAVASGGLSGSAGGSVTALSPPATANFAVDTTTAGAVSGTIQVTSSSQAVANGSIARMTAGTVVRRANASFSDASDEDSHVASLTLDTDTGVHAINVVVFNYGFDSLQALLDIDGVTGVGSPFTFVGGLQNGLGAGAATLTFEFDSTGAAPGPYSSNVSIAVSDEDLPGATGGVLSLTLDVMVNGAAPCPGDATGDGSVDNADLQAILDAWASSSGDPNYSAVADFNSDGVIDNADLQALLDHWATNCP